MYKKIIALVCLMSLFFVSSCNPVDKADKTLQDVGQLIADTCTPDNSFADSCNNLP